LNGAVGDWIGLAGCALAIGYAGARLTRLADTISDKAALSASWIGLLLLAAVTSLPELATGISAVTVARAPNIAVGDALGSTAFNLALLVLVDALYKPGALYARASQEHVLPAAFGALLLCVVGLGVLLEHGDNPLPAVGHVGSPSLLLFGLYLVAMRGIFVHCRRQLATPADALPRPHDPELRDCILRFAGFAAIVAAAGIWLPVVGVRIADDMGWSRTFVGTLLIAAATSLPEVVVTVAALRLGRVDMAIASLLGSNLFDIVIIAIDDVFHAPGPILADVAPLNAVTALFAAAMSVLVIIGLVYRAPGWRRAPGMVSLALLALYVANAWVLYSHQG
jgi:cation:H+ antiporter